MNSIEVEIVYNEWRAKAEISLERYRGKWTDYLEGTCYLGNRLPEGVLKMDYSTNIGRVILKEIDIFHGRMPVTIPIRVFPPFKGQLKEALDSLK